MDTPNCDLAEWTVGRVRIERIYVSEGPVESFFSKCRLSCRISTNVPKLRCTTV